jgi:hypothetical protein
MQMRHVAIIREVLIEIVNHESAAVRHEFFRAQQRLEEATDPRSWDELATLPAKDPEVLPDDT